MYGLHAYETSQDRTVAINEIANRAFELDGNFQRVPKVVRT